MANFIMQNTFQHCSRVQSPKASSENQSHLLTVSSYSTNSESHTTSMSMTQNSHPHFKNKELGIARTDRVKARPNPSGSTPNPEAPCPAFEACDGSPCAPSGHSLKPHSSAVRLEAHTPSLRVQLHLRLASFLSVSTFHVLYSFCLTFTASCGGL